MVLDIVGSWEMESVCGIDCDSETEEEGEDSNVMDSEDVAEAGGEVEADDDTVGFKDADDERDRVKDEVFVNVTHSAMSVAPRR